MNNIFRFLLKWIVPIGFVKIIANDKIFTLDEIEKQTYWRLSDSKKHKGAEILIRRS
jgi:hypothetical protein